MYCSKCGAQNGDNNYKCETCGEILQEQGSPGALPQTVPNYLAQSILVTLFCCLPVGIAAIVHAAQVNSKLMAGDIKGALQSSRQAKTWSTWSFGLGSVGLILYVIVVALSAIN